MSLCVGTVHVRCTSYWQGPLSEWRPKAPEGSPNLSAKQTRPSGARRLPDLLGLQHFPRRGLCSSTPTAWRPSPHSVTISCLLCLCCLLCQEDPSFFSWLALTHPAVPTPSTTFSGAGLPHGGSSTRMDLQSTLSLRVHL